MPYKILDPKTGLFQEGGHGFRGPVWARSGKPGKTWRTLGHVRQHFGLLREYARGFNPIDPTWVLVEYVVVESNRKPVAEIL